MPSPRPSGTLRCGFFDFLGDGADVDPAVVGPDDGDHRQADRLPEIERQIAGGADRLQIREFALDQTAADRAIRNSRKPTLMTVVMFCVRAAQRVPMTLIHVQDSTSGDA